MNHKGENPGANPSDVAQYLNHLAQVVNDRPPPHSTVMTPCQPAQMHVPSQDAAADECTAAALRSLRPANNYPDDATISRWCRLFTYHPQQAVQLIMQQRATPENNVLTAYHWEIIARRREENGYDRESYEHVLRLGTEMKKRSLRAPGQDTERVHPVSIDHPGEGPLTSPELVQQIAGMSRLPMMSKGKGILGTEKNYALLNTEQYARVQTWLNVHWGQQQRRWDRMNNAEKERANANRMVRIMEMEKQAQQTKDRRDSGAPYPK